jgi:hypothetical protein
MNSKHASLQQLQMLQGIYHSASGERWTAGEMHAELEIAFTGKCFAAAVNPHHRVVPAEVLVVETAAVLGPVEGEAWYQENVVVVDVVFVFVVVVVVVVVESPAAGTDPLLLVHVLLSVGLSPTASLDDSCSVFRGFRGFVAA